MWIINKITIVIYMLFYLTAYSQEVTEKGVMDSAGTDTVSTVLKNDTLFSEQAIIRDTIVPFVDTLNDTVNSKHQVENQRIDSKIDSTDVVIIEGVVIDQETGNAPDDSIVVLIDTSVVTVNSSGEFLMTTVKKPYFEISIKSKKYSCEQKAVTFIEGKLNYFVTLQLSRKKDTVVHEKPAPEADTSRIPWTITGTIVDSRFDLVIESDSTVLIFDADTVKVTENVNFIVTTRVSGSHVFYVRIPGYHPVTVPVVLDEKDKQLFITIPTTVLDKQITRREITVSAKRLPVHRSAQVAKIDVSRKELQRTVATFNDPIRVLHTLPGVASESDVSARPIVQGGDFDEARVFLDGVPLLQPYHYGGVRSTFNQQGVNQLTLYKTGFPAEMHNAQSALIDVSSRIPSDEKPSFEFDLNPLQYSTYLGFPLFKSKAGLNFSSQGSFHEQVLKLITNIGSRAGNEDMERVTKLINIPDYKDFSAGLSLAPSPRIKIFVNEMFNSDRTKFTTGDSVVNVTYNYRKWDWQQNKYIVDTSITQEKQYAVWDTGSYRYYQPLIGRSHDGNPVVGKPWFDVDTIIDYKSRFNILYAKVQYIPNEKFIFNTAIAWQKRWWDLNFPGSYNISDELFGKNKYNVDLDQWNLNSGLIYSGIKNHLIKAGAQLDYTAAHYDVYILRYLHKIITSGSTNFHDFWGAMNGDTARVFSTENENVLYTLMDRILVSYKGDKRYFNAACYASDGWDVSDRIRLDVGARVEYNRADHVTAISPRLTLKYNVSEKNELLGSLGHYTQNNYELDVMALSEKLKPEKVWHVTGGLETKLLPWLTQKVDAYGKYYYDLASEIVEEQYAAIRQYFNPIDLVSGNYSDTFPDISNEITAVDQGFRSLGYRSRYTNEGKGVAFGFEYLLRYDPTDFWHGWLSLSWGKSVRWRREGWRKHPFPLDRPLLISINNYYRLPRKYEISLKYRYMSGLPYTSVENYQNKIMVGNFNDERYSAYQRLDIRFSKGFSVKSVKGNLYTEIWNAFNSPNLFGLDSKSKNFVTILPNFPVTMLYAGVECIF